MKGACPEGSVDSGIVSEREISVDGGFMPLVSSSSIEIIILSALTQ